jgi:hypothetical protein
MILVRLHGILYLENLGGTNLKKKTPYTLGHKDFRLEEDASASQGLAGQTSKLLRLRPDSLICTCT